MTLDRDDRQSPMSHKPITKVVERRRSVRSRTRDTPNRPAATQVVNEASNTRRVVLRNALLPSAARALAPMCAECLDCLFVDFGEVYASCFNPPAEVNG